MIETDRTRAHRDHIEQKMRDGLDMTYSADLFAKRWPDVVRQEWWLAENLRRPGLTEGEVMALQEILAATVCSCDDVECDPVMTALTVFERLLPLLRV